jgi:hypothetical protein
MAISWRGYLAAMLGVRRCSATLMSAPAIDLDRLLKLRVAIARVGEGELAGWWNSKGQLGRMGARALARGFPRSHPFAQARSVFAVAAHRCAEVFEPPGSVTLWRLDPGTEEAFDARWERWLDSAADWSAFFDAVAGLTGADVIASLRALALVDAADLERFGKLRRSGHAVALPGLYAATDADVALLALGFGRGQPGDLAVPYARRADA